MGQVPSAFNCILHLLLSCLVHQLGLIVGKLRRTHFPLVFSHHKGVLLDLTVLGVCQTLEIGIHILSLLRLVVVVTIFLMSVLLGLSGTRLIATNSHLLRDAAISQGRKFLLRCLVPPFRSLSQGRENRLLCVDPSGASLLLLSAIGPALDRFLMQISFEASWGDSLHISGLFAYPRV